MNAALIAVVSTGLLVARGGSTPLLNQIRNNSQSVALFYYGPKTAPIGEGKDVFRIEPREQVVINKPIGFRTPERMGLVLIRGVATDAMGRKKIISDAYTVSRDVTNLQEPLVQIKHEAITPGAEPLLVSEIKSGEVNLVIKENGEPSLVQRAASLIKY